MRFQGVPIHPALVHFPVAAWTAATITSWGALYTPGLGIVSLWCNIIALAIAPLVMLFGLIEFLDIPENSETAKAASHHMLLAGGTFTAYLLLLIVQSLQMPIVSAALATAGLALLVLAGHAGARIVYHYGFPRRSHSHE